MATTTNEDSTRDWTLVIADSVTLFFLTNYGEAEVEVFSKATAPTTTDKGHVLRKYEGITSSTFPTGEDIYLRGQWGKSTIVITQ